jgi:hypothetical protein
MDAVSSGPRRLTPAEFAEETEKRLAQIAE